jgi:hypothetical protein
MRRSVVLAISIAAATVMAGAIHPSPALATGSTISGTVYDDANRNGQLDAGEAPFANAIVDVYAGSAFVTSVSTDANGSFQAARLADNTYTVLLDGTSWSPLRDTWVATTTGTLRPTRTVTISGSAVVDLGLRKIVRSTTMGSPLSTYQAANGLLVNSYDDAVDAKTLYDDLAGVQLTGAEAAVTTLNFDSPSTLNDTVSNVFGGPPYSGYTATMYVTYDTWIMSGDETLVHEYGHAWSKYHADITQQDPSFASYLQARGLTGNPNLGTNWMWEPSELIAEDYRQLFGTPNAASYPQANTDLPPAASVPGLRSFLQSTFTTGPSGGSSVPAASVSAVSPGVGAATGGTQVTVSGSGFAGQGWTTTGVRVGGASASFSVVSPTQLTVTLPPGSGTQDVTVTVGSSGASSTSPATSADRVTYAPVPTGSGVTPSSGGVRGGTKVTVYGTGFSGAGFTAQAVRFGGVAGSKLVVVSPTQLTVLTPAAAGTGTVSVVISTPGGTSAAGSTSVFTYKRK